MSPSRLPGPLCAVLNNIHIDAGTLCRQSSPLPGPTGRDSKNHSAFKTATLAVDPILLKKIRDNLDRWEAPKLFMYLDSEGLVTVGCGTMLPDVASAQAVPFFHNDTRAPASNNEKQAAWQHLNDGAQQQKSAAPNKKFAAQHYRNETGLRITLETSNLLRDEHIKSDHQQLKKIYSHFDGFPDNAKLALFDMIYNLGPQRLRRYVRMNIAIGKRDWLTAAGQSHRGGIPVERNLMIQTLLSNCASGVDRF